MLIIAQKLNGSIQIKSGDKDELDKYLRSDVSEKQWVFCFSGNQTAFNDFLNLLKKGCNITIGELAERKAV
ncbi:MAG: hypothetical protein FWC26_03185 [Fibromonadales bacterium]|nr:hypothetical protein [Fibromonadales bacterium]